MLEIIDRSTEYMTPAYTHEDLKDNYTHCCERIDETAGEQDGKI